MFSSASSIGENSVSGIKTQQTTSTVLAPPKRAALVGLSLNSGGVKTSSINSSSSSLDVEYCSASSLIHQSIISTSSITSELFGSNNTSVLSLKKLKSVGQRVAASVVSSSHIHLENDDELNSSKSLKMTHVTKTKSTLGTIKPSSFAIFEEDLDEGSIIPSSDPSADQGDEWADLINEF
jgi:hypothetical protein